MILHDPLVVAEEYASGEPSLGRRDAYRRLWARDLSDDVDRPLRGRRAPMTGVGTT